jgi:DNA-binding NarL/FixJ family response regulator
VYTGPTNGQEQQHTNAHTFFVRITTMSIRIRKNYHRLKIVKGLIFLLGWVPSAYTFAFVSQQRHITLEHVKQQGRRRRDGFVPSNFCQFSNRRILLLFSHQTQLVDPFGDSIRKFRSQHWILLVDDEVAIRDAVGQMLLCCGYQVTTCPDGREALRIALNGQRDTDPTSSLTMSLMVAPRSIPDVIVSDVRMPVMDGLTLLEMIRSNQQLVEVPVILLTAKGMPQDRIAGYNAGADAYIPKPFDPDELVSVIDNVIQRHERLNDSNNVALSDLQRDLQDIKYLLIEKGGAGVGRRSDRVEATNVFLAPDERQILSLLCQGRMNKEIAEQMYMSTRRVEQLLTSMYRKVKVKNRTELVRWAISTGNVKI